MNEKERTARFNNLIDVIRKSDSFFMPIEQHECGTPACISGHCKAYFDEDIDEYLGINSSAYFWLLHGRFSKKHWADITQDDAITALEMVRDYKVPDDPREPEPFTID